MRLIPRLSGAVQVTCIHHVPKRQFARLMYDTAKEKPAECMCCENVFAYPFNVQDKPLFCPACTLENVGGLHG